MRATLSHHILAYSSHLDLFLEVNNRQKLLTYECSINQIEDFYQGLAISFFKKNDHRYIYLDFEGNISNNRGFLKILWKGYYNEELDCNDQNINVRLNYDRLYMIN